MNEWQPIETAPKDGSEILVCNGIGRRAVTHWMEGRGFYAGQGGGYPASWTTIGDLALTHWMPLPPPPEVKK